MKRLYLIGGPMGVGKTTVCRRLLGDLPHCVFLDGDWCWFADPFVVTEETRAMVMDNIVHTLRNFLGCTAYEHIVFAWVMHEQAIIEAILRGLDTRDCEVFCVSLTASAKTLRARLQADVARGLRTADVTERSLLRLPLYANLQTVKITTDGKTVSQIAGEIRSLGERPAALP